MKENEDEIEDVVKEVRSEMKDIYKENDRIVKNVQRTAVKMIPKIDSMADKANNVAKRSLINLAREEMRATKEALVSGKADAKEVLGEQREEIKSMSSDMRDVEKDLQAERSGIKAGSIRAVDLPQGWGWGLGLAILGRSLLGCIEADFRK